MAARINIGDAVEPRRASTGIVLPGVARWYALRCAPQREDAVEGWLARRGVYAFHPVLQRVAHRAGVARVYHRRYLPGYVFARFGGDPVVHQVLTCPWIIGALCRSDGEWGVLEPSRLREIHAMRRIDDDLRQVRAGRSAARRRAVRLRVGDRAMFRAGPLAEVQCEVVELIADGGARVRLGLFGREMLVDGRAEDLVRLRKAG